MIRVLIVDDHASFREPLAALLDQDPEITVVGSVAGVDEAEPFLAGTDVALVDLDLDTELGVDVIDRFARDNRQTACVVLTGTRDRLEIARAIEAGALGAIHKSAPVAEVREAVQLAARGEYLMSVQETMDLLRLAGRKRREDHEIAVMLERLTPREREVLEQLAKGRSDRQIADELVISVETVRSHVSSILSQFGVESRLQAVIFAVRNGIVELHATEKE